MEEAKIITSVGCKDLIEFNSLLTLLLRDCWEINNSGSIGIGGDNFWILLIKKNKKVKKNG